MRNRHFFLILWVLILVVSAIGKPAAAQSSDGLYFPETNKWVRGEFLRFYLSSPSPSVLFGLPISEEMVDSTGTRVQYFERARFELRMTDKGLVVKLANLGWLSIENEAPAVDLRSGQEPLNHQSRVAVQQPVQRGHARRPVRMRRSGTGCGCRALHIRSGFAATDVHDTILRDELQNAKKPGLSKKPGI